MFFLLLKYIQEIPHAFVAKYGDRISNPLNISLGGGYRTSFMYSHSDRKIHGLKVFFEQYEVLDEYVIIFYYFGEANFSVEVYNSEGLNHLVNSDGQFRVELFQKTLSNEPTVDEVPNLQYHLTASD